MSTQNEKDFAKIAKQNDYKKSAYSDNIYIKDNKKIVIGRDSTTIDGSRYNNPSDGKKSKNL